MAENKVVIEVEVQGAGNAQRTLDGIASTTSRIGASTTAAGAQLQNTTRSATQQASQLGETFTAVGDHATRATGAASRGVLAVSGGLGAANDSAVTLGRAMVTLADNGGRGMIAILGPIGAVIATIYTLYEGYQNLSGGTKEYEKIIAATTATASDLTSKLDALAAKGIRLSSGELQEMIRSLFDARMGIEYMNEQVAESTEVFAEYAKAKRELAILQGEEVDLVKENLWYFEKLGKLYMDLWKIGMEDREMTQQITDAQKKLADSTKKLTEYEKALSDAYEKKIEISTKEELAQIRRETLRSEAIDQMKAEFKAMADLDKMMKEISSKSEYEKNIAFKLIDIDTQEKILDLQNLTKDQILDLVDKTKKLNQKNSEGILPQLEKVKLQKELNELKDEEFKKAFEADKAEAEREASRKASEAKARADAFRARQQQIIGEQSQINALRIQLEKDGIDEQIALAVNTYTTQQKLNKNNKNQLIIAELQYQQQLNSIAEQEMARQQASQLALEQSQLAKIGALQEEAYKEIEIEKTKEQAKKDLTDKIALLDIQLTQTGYDQQIAMLNKQMEIELAIVEKGSLAELEIKKRYQLATKGMHNESITMLRDFADAQAQSFTASLASAIMGGESIQAVLKASLQGLATEALARSLYEGAAGLASLALGPVGDVPASQHFAASAAFAGVATVAGLAGASIPSSKASASSGASPSGIAQTTQVQRPEAQKSEPMVFNVNFAGATIYDTKESAKRALSDEIVKYINEPRRGSPRLRVQNA